MHQEAYDKAEGLRRSDLWKMHISPLHFKTAMEAEEKTATPALIFGIAVHKYILEPDDFFNEYIIAPKVDRRTKAGKEEWAAFEQQCFEENKEPLDEATFDQIKAMAYAVNANPLAKAMLTGQHETEWYWTDTTTGEKLKCKCDNLTTYQNKNYCVDYKTTDSCEDGHFERSVRKFGYQFQTGFYTEGLYANTNQNYGFAFVVQEKKSPYACRVYICSDKFIENGKIVYHQLVNLYHNCKLTDNWYGYEGESTNPQPTMLLDDSERYQKNDQNLYHVIYGNDNDEDIPIDYDDV